METLLVSETLVVSVKLITTEGLLAAAVEFRVNNKTECFELGDGVLNFAPVDGKTETFNEDGEAA